MTRLITLLFMIFVAQLSTQDAVFSQGPDDGVRVAAERAGAMKSNGSASKSTEGSAKKSSDGSNKKMNDSAAAGSSSKTRSSAPFKTKPLTLMAVLDIDGDGKLSGSEIDFATDQLLRLDVNDNGEIDPDELPGSKPAMVTEFDTKYAGPGQQIYKTLSGFDKNADGMLTRSEMKADYRGVFRSIDTDQDKAISPNELMEFAKTQ